MAASGAFSTGKRELGDLQSKALSGVQQEVGPRGFPGFARTLTMGTPRRWGEIAGPCWTPSQRFVPCTASASGALARIPFHELKNHSFINKEILPSIQSEIRNKNHRTKVIFLFAWKNRTSSV